MGVKIETIEEKLFYVLFYLKTYPTFDMASFYVGFARSKAHKMGAYSFSHPRTNNEAEISITRTKDIQP